jgi:glycosyltransferase involved in cell wall biosynthesis
MTANRISVIVPIYNAEKYLNKCLDSIVNQSYKNLEIILINDGSTDTSSSLINEYAAKDKRIVSIEKKNGGVGSAYRIAFENVTGAYISFVDSDDYIELNMYEELIKIVKENKPDIIHFGYILVNDMGKKLQNNNTINDIIEGNDKILNKHFTFVKDPSLACRLFKSNLFTEVNLIDQNVGIDEIVFLQVLCKCEKVVHIQKFYYYANARENSVSRACYSKEKIKQYIMVHRFLCNFMDKTNRKYSPYLYLKYLKLLLPVYEFTRVSKELRGSEEQYCLMNDLISYYNKAKGTYEFKGEEMLFKVKMYTFIKCTPLVPYVSFLILCYNIFIKYAAKIVSNRG